MKRRYDTMTLTHDSFLKKVMPLSVLRTDSDVSVMSVSCQCHTYCHRVSVCGVKLVKCKVS